MKIASVGRLLVMGFIALTLGTSTSRADSWARITPSLGRNEKIVDLEWSKLRFPISDSRTVDLSGSVSEGSFVLLVTSPATQKLTLSPIADSPGRLGFRMRIRMPGKSAVILLRRIDDFGRVQNEKIILIEVASDDQGSQVKLSSERANPWHFGLGLGISSQDYNEISSGTHLIQESISSSLSAIYSISPRWIANANFEFTLAPLSNSLVSLPNARFFDLDGRVGYRLPVATNSAFLMLEAGWYSWGMIVPSGAYGVTYLGGPEFYVFSGFNWIPSHPLWFYAKYASIESGSTLFSSTGRELSGGVTYQLTSSGFKGPPLQLHLSYLKSQYSDPANQFRFSQVDLGLQIGL